VKVLKKKRQFIKKSDCYFAERDAKVERRHYFLEINEDANLLFRRIRVGGSDISSWRRRSDAIFAEISTQLSRDSSGIDSFYARSEILFV